MHAALIITVYVCMYECRETRQKWHRAAVAVTTYYRIRSLSLSPFFFLSLYVLSFSFSFSFNLFFFRTFPVCSEDDKWEEEETYIHTNQWAVLYYRKKEEEEGKIEWKQIRCTHTHHLIAVIRKNDNIQYVYYCLLAWSQNNINRRKNNYSLKPFLRS